jgi:hypothetical protein
MPTWSMRWIVMRTRGMFAAAGFTEVSQPSVRRVVMRFEL